MTLLSGLVLTTEQQQLKDSVRRFLFEHAPLAAARSAAERGTFDPSTWKRLTAELGLTALSVAPEHGGLGAAWPEVAVVFEELGYALLAAPLLPVLLATTVLQTLGDGLDLLPGLADGGLIATLALSRDGGLWSADRVALTAAGGRLSGDASFVLEGATADVLLVAARDSDGLSLFAVDGGAAGLSRTRLNVLDGTRPLASLTFRDTPARLLGTAGQAQQALTRSVALGLIALGAEQTGVAQRALDDATAYAKTRQQFGRAIGSFQAVKHLLAEVLVKVESARSAVRYAAATVTEGDLEVRASMVKSWCSDTAYRATADSIQVHGGIGYTWEHDAHLLFKRAVSSAHLWGEASAHRLRVADAMEI